jgi:hypothetical protein
MFCGKSTPFWLLKLSANPPALCATKRGWISSNSPERSPDYFSILLLKFTEMLTQAQVS